MIVKYNLESLTVSTFAGRTLWGSDIRVVVDLQTHSDIPHGQRVTQQRGRRARRNPLHRQPGASDSGFVSLQQSPNSSDVSGMGIGDASPPASNNGSFDFGNVSALQSYSNSEYYSHCVCFLEVP